MTALLIILLISSILACVLTCILGGSMLTNMKKNVDRLNEENSILRAKNMKLEESKASDQRYFNRKLMETRSELNKNVRFTRELEAHHRTVEGDLRVAHRETLEQMAQENFLMPNYRPFELTAA